MKATRDDWAGGELHPIVSAKHLQYSRRLSAAETDFLREGVVPKEMEDHRFIFEEDDVVHLYRSWTGMEFAAFELQPVPNGGSEITEVLTNAPEEESRDILDVFFDSLSPRRGSAVATTLSDSLKRHVFGVNRSAPRTPPAP